MSFMSPSMSMSTTSAAARLRGGVHRTHILAAAVLLALVGCGVPADLPKPWGGGPTPELADVETSIRVAGDARASNRLDGWWQADYVF